MTCVAMVKCTYTHEQSSAYSDFDNYNDDTESKKYFVFVAYYGFDTMCLLFLFYTII